LPAVTEKLLEIIFKLKNSPPYKARFVTDFQVEQGIETLGIPPYSNDLGPSRIYLFEILKLSIR
jgi:hypothetical protein